MDCPTCGVANPEGASKCSCGYELQSARFPATPEWEISLAWRQKMAAYWSISWPAEIGWFFALSVMTSRYATPQEVTEHVGSVNLIAYLLFFAIQSLLVGRLVRKNYRSFRLYVVHPDGGHARRLSLYESVCVALCVAGFQIAFIIALLVTAIVFGDQFQILKRLAGVEVWLRFFIAGPYAIALALRIRYPGFRLQASGLRYI